MNSKTQILETITYLNHISTITRCILEHVWSIHTSSKHMVSYNASYPLIQMNDVSWRCVLKTFLRDLSHFCGTFESKQNSTAYHRHLIVKSTEYVIKRWFDHSHPNYGTDSTIFMVLKTFDKYENFTFDSEIVVDRIRQILSH
jgi:hypothetical protein